VVVIVRARGIADKQVVGNPGKIHGRNLTTRIAFMLWIVTSLREWRCMWVKPVTICHSEPQSGEESRISRQNEEILRSLRSLRMTNKNVNPSNSPLAEMPGPVSPLIYATIQERQTVF
jgi:hypothetical protein